MKTIAIFFCLLLVGSGSLFAQKNIREVLSNPDVVWAATSFSDFHPDKDKKYHRSFELSGQSDFIKLLVKPYKGEAFYPMNDGQNNSFSAKIFSPAFFEANSLFTTAELTKSISEEEKARILTYTDSLAIADPSTKQIKKIAIKKTFNPDDVLFYRVQQLVFYNKKDTAFKTIPMAIAPVIGVYNAKGERTGFTTMFWIPVFSTAITDVQSEDHTWIKRTAYNVPLEKDCKINKEVNQLPEVHNLFLNALQANAENTLTYDCYEILGHERLPALELKNIKTLVDTIITFDPVSFEEKVSVVKRSEWYKIGFGMIKLSVYILGTLALLR